MTQSSFRTSHSALAASLCLSLLLPVACGGDDFTSPTGNSGGAGGTAGVAGNGGVGGSAGSTGGAAGDAGAAASGGSAGTAGSGGAAGDAGSGGAAGSAGAAGSGGLTDCTGVEDGTPCEADGGNTLCIADACVESECGDGYVDESQDEFCDDGKNGDDADGCTDLCQATCTKDADCDDGNPCNGVETCGGNVCVAGSAVNCDDGNPCTTDACIMGNGQCSHQGLDDGTACGAGKLCLAESCKTSVCGDGWVDASKGEECDDRKNGNQTDGCKDDCKFTCKTNADCNDSNACTTDVCNTAAHTCTNTTISCDDGDACTADSCNQTTGCVYTFIDEDHDGYSPNTCKVGGPYATKGGDCADTGANASSVNPGVTAYFTTDHSVAGVPAFDYNCSGTAELASTKRYAGNCSGTTADKLIKSGWTGLPPTCGVTGTWHFCVDIGSGGGPQPHTQACH